VVSFTLRPLYTQSRSGRGGLEKNSQPGIKQSGHEADHSLPSSAEVRMRGAIPQFHNAPSWRSARLKNRDSFMQCYVITRIMSKALCLCAFLTKHGARKAYCGSRGIYLHAFFNLCTRWRRVASFMPRPLYTQRKSPVTHWIGGWVVPRAGLDAAVKRKIPSPRGHKHFSNYKYIPAAVKHSNRWRSIKLVTTDKLLIAWKDSA
jgi:hypothetical protein